MNQRSSIVDLEWHSTPEGEADLQKFYYSKPPGKKPFGVLDRPLSTGSIEEVSYKIHFLGKSGVGKTNVISKLAGVSSTNIYAETPGIRVTDIYWPVRIWEKTILFKLKCWEAGASCMKKYSHISKVCGEGTDLVVFMFGLNDSNSFLDIGPAISRQAQSEANTPAFLAIGTRYNPNSKLEVTNNDIRELETKCNIKVISFPNIPQGQDDISKTTPILNTICETLWIRDQQYILNQGITI